MTQKIKNKLNLRFLWLRLLLTVVILLTFFLMFFLGGGIVFFRPELGIKNFQNLPFEIHFIDVGLGDSIFMRFPSGKTMLVDSGPNTSSNNVVDYLYKLFKLENLTEIDYFVITHQDADHVGKGDEIFDAFQVNTFYRPKILSNYEVETYGNDNNFKVSTTKTYDAVIKAGYNELNCQMLYSERGIELYDHDLSVKFLSPSKDKYSNFNNYSPMIMVTYKTTKFLLTGDAESVTEKEVIESYASELKADVLKVGHHGSDTSTSQELLNFVKPSYAVISVSESNKWNFPKKETLDKLNAIEAQILTTAEQGSIVMSEQNGKIVMFDKQIKCIFDIPSLIVCCSVALIIVWFIKIPKKKKPRIKNQ